MVLRCNEVAVDLVTVKSFELNASHCLKQTGVNTSEYASESFPVGELLE